MSLASLSLLPVLLAGCSGPGGVGNPYPDAGSSGPEVAESDTTTPAKETSAEGTTGDSAADAADAIAPSYGTPCAPADRVGLVKVAHEEFYSAVTATIKDGVVPLTLLQEVESEGDCKLLRKQNPFCDPPCTGGQACDHDGTCIAYPANQDAGTITVTGLAEAVSMNPDAVKSYSDTKLPFPMFKAGDAVGVTASGASVSAFSLGATGVEMLAMPDEVLELATGKALELQWTAAPGPAKIALQLNIDQHGNSPVTLSCLVADTGAYSIGATLVDALRSYGVSGFASLDVYRQTVDSAPTTTGCVELRVYSYRPGKLTVAGHTACNQDPECPPGQTCNKAIQTCE